MKTEDLKNVGLTEEQISFVMAENGKDVNKAKKDFDTISADRDNWKSQAETAQNTLTKFDGIDPEKIDSEIADWKKKAKDAEEMYTAKIREREFEDALKAELDNVKFSSEAAKRSVMIDIKAAGLKLIDGKILGLKDLLDQMKEKDASAFVDESEKNAKNNMATFTSQVNKNQQGTLTKNDILSIKDATERQAAIAANINLFREG
nr:MAG TPA: minor structural protein [Caudoviricetes sp.]